MSKKWCDGCSIWETDCNPFKRWIKEWINDNRNEEKKLRQQKSRSKA